jgi:hypothetical protein
MEKPMHHPTDETPLVNGDAHVIPTQFHLFKDIKEHHHNKKKQYVDPGAKVQIRLSDY